MLKLFKNNTLLFYKKIQKLQKSIQEEIFL